MPRVLIGVQVSPTSPVISVMPKMPRSGPRVESSACEYMTIERKKRQDCSTHRFHRVAALEVSLLAAAGWLVRSRRVSRCIGMSGRGWGVVLSMARSGQRKVEQSKEEDESVTGEHG
jgi:hypothetical protein